MTNYYFHYLTLSDATVSNVEVLKPNTCRYFICKCGWSISGDGSEVFVHHPFCEKNPLLNQPMQCRISKTREKGISENLLSVVAMSCHAKIKAFVTATSVDNFGNDSELDQSVRVIDIRS